jgi:hypothetical protein
MPIEFMCWKKDLFNEKGLYYAMWRQQIGERKATTAVPSLN